MHHPVSCLLNARNFHRSKTIFPTLTNAASHLTQFSGEGRRRYSSLHRGYFNCLSVYYYNFLMKSTPFFNFLKLFLNFVECQGKVANSGRAVALGQRHSNVLVNIADFNVVIQQLLKFAADFL